MSQSSIFNPQSSKRGFTLLEIILTMALVAIVALFASPFSGQFLYAQEVTVVTDELKSSLTKARLYSMLGKNGAPWGVAVDQETIVLFQGDSFANRVPEMDERFDIRGRVTLSGLTEIIYSQGTGKPTTEPTVTISGYGQTETLVINAEGVIE